MDPTRLSTYIHLLLTLERFDAAAVQLQRAIQVSAEHGRSAYDLFEKLCTLAVTHPAALRSVSVQAVLRASLRHFPHHAAPFWIALARFWISHGRLERARAVFDEALRTVVAVRDFAQVFETYLAFEESVLVDLMHRLQAHPDNHRDTVEIDLRLLRLEKLMRDRPVLVNEVRLRQNPQNVKEWLKRVALVQQGQAEEATPGGVARVFEDAIATVVPALASQHVDELWIAYAKHVATAEDVEAAFEVFEKAVQVPFKQIKELANVWIAYAEMAVEHHRVVFALQLLGRATAIPANTHVDYFDNKLSPQKRLFKSLPLWNYYVDLEECFGTYESVQSVYTSMLDLKIATPQVILNYALYLESNDAFEASFKVYERGIELFGWPIAFELWNIYLPKFLERYPATKLERTRELFEMALEACPADLCAPLFVVYGHMEETHGLARRAMRIYERAAHRVPLPHRFEMYAYYISRVVHFFGLVSAREVYERALVTLPDSHAPLWAMAFAQLEVKLGEVERARAIYAHGSQFCDPRMHGGYWAAWHVFEVQFGNEDTFKEMLRIKRSVQAQYNTELNYISAQLAAASAANTSSATSSTSTSAFTPSSTSSSTSSSTM